MRGGSRPVVVPGELAWERRGDGPAGLAWLEALPGQVDAWCARWSLTRDPGPLRSGAHALVVPVRRGDEPCVLKLSWHGGVPAGEIAALEAWAGRGAVRLLEHDLTGEVVLLERRDADRPLSAVDVGTAGEVVGSLIARLAVPLPDPGVIRSTTDVAGDIAATLPDRQARLGNPVPAALLATALGCARDLAAARPAVPLLVHADLHGDNVLAGVREPWLAVDPLVAVGDPERAVAELLWTRADDLADAAAIRRLLATVVDAGGLRADLARAWALARAVDYWLWGLGVGLTVDPPRCARVVEALS